MTSSDKRTSDCASCGDKFQYIYTRGPGPKYCSDYCRRNARHAFAKAKPLCVFSGCKNPRHYKSGLCNSCYYRVRRTGTLDKRVFAFRSLSSHGYVRVGGEIGKNHPLAVGGYVYEHRQVLYDRIGQGPHPCHWCGTSVAWVKGKCVKRSLVPDHLDGDKSNNDSENLVPSCNDCNATRGLFMAWVRDHKDDPWLWNMYVSSLKAKADKKIVLTTLFT